MGVLMSGKVGEASCLATRRSSLNAEDLSQRFAKVMDVELLRMNPNVQKVAFPATFALSWMLFIAPSLVFECRCKDGMSTRWTAEREIAAYCIGWKLACTV